MAVHVFPVELVRAGESWNRARATERRLAAELYEAIRVAHENGTPETSIAEYAGVDRMTVRRALGKL